VTSNEWLTIDVLEDYLDGKLDAKMMNRVERESLEDPFVAQALAGLSQSPKRSLQSLSLLQKQLESRIAEQHQQKTKSVITWQRLSIAATAAVIFIAVSIVFWMRQNNNLNPMAGQTQTVEVNLDPASNMEAIKPVGGWAAFFIYVKKNNALAASGKIGKAVELSFKIDASGKPADIKVLKSPGAQYSAESIRLLQDGPAWQIPADPSKTTRVNIEF
jgi:hypothetical protein